MRTASELRSPGAVTVLVLLLLVGGVDSRSGDALTWAAHVLVAEDTRHAPVMQTRSSQREPVIAQVCATERLSDRSVRRVLSVLDATLPAPRAPGRLG